MSRATELLTELDRLGVTVWADGPRLRYRAVAGSLTVALREELNRLKGEILPLLPKQDPAASELPPITPGPPAEPTPLSLSQLRLWFAEQLGGAVYNMPMVVEVEGLLDVPVLERSLSELIRRHSVLRSRILERHGEPMQEAAEPQPFRLRRLDLSGLPHPDRPACIESVVSEDVTRPFRLADGLLVRGAAVRLDERSHVLVMVLHHIACDGWSLGLILREVATLYHAFRDGRPSPLPDPTLQYADFARWQHGLLARGAFALQVAYWRHQLEGYPDHLELPLDHPRPPMQSFRGRTEHFTLLDGLADDIARVGHPSGATPFMTLLAAYAAILGRYSGQERLVVGCPMSGRSRRETEGLVGFFVNVLPLPVDLTGDPTFPELLGRVRTSTAGAFANQDVPIDRLLDELKRTRDPGRNPLVQAAFTLDSHPAVPSLALPGLEIRPLPADTGTAKTDLSLTLQPRGRGYSASVEYATDLFEPTTVARVMRDYESLLKEIAADPRRRLSELLGAAGIAAPTPARTPARAADDLDGLLTSSNMTENQLHIWFGHHLAPDKPIYNNGGVFTIHHRVDVDRFLGALRALIASYDSLRTVYEEVDGVPRRRVLESYEPSQPYIDFSGEENPAARAMQWSRDQFEKAFDFRTPPYQFALLKVGDDEFRWYYNTHQIAVDAVSATWVIKAMSRSYRLEVESPAPAPPPQFEEFVAEERAFRESSRYRKARAHWDEWLSQPSEPVAFFGVTPKKASTRVEKRTCTLGVERTARLKELARAIAPTSATVDLAAFNALVAMLATLIHQISGARRLTFGVPQHNRRSKSSKEGIGSYMQIAPIRFEVSGGDRLEGLTRKVSEAMLENLRYGQCVVRNPQDSHLYDMMINYHPQSFPDLAGIPLLAADYFHSGHAAESLGIQIRDFGESGNLLVDFDFHCDVFDPDQRAQMLYHFLRVVDTFLDDPHRAVGDVTLLNCDEGLAFAQSLNAPDVERYAGRTVPELVARQAARCPGRTAVAQDARTLTYGELDARAGRLAQRLRALGVTTESRVALCLGRSPELIVSLLGVWKAGAAFVPLDPSVPEARRRWTVDDAGCAVVLTRGSLAREFEGTGARVVDLEQEPTDIDRLDELPDWPAPHPLQAAYVIYTSGSTGTPKGVVVPHEALAAFAMACVDGFALTPADRVLQFHSIAFDAAGEEIYPCLLAGATLVLGPDGGHGTNDELFRYCRASEVTVLDFPTAYWHPLVTDLVGGRVRLPEATRLVIIGGERVAPERVAAWRRHTGDCPRLLNTYGPTEATVTATSFACDDCATGREVPIGKPLRHQRLYVLDPKLRPVPVGLPGELCLGGIGLARGYLGRPGLTAASFVPDPFDTRPGARMYRTGDLARYQPDGHVEFLGRIDQQTKIRGFRIEPGEVEAALNQHPDVRESIVAVRDDHEGGPYLATYLVTRSGGLPGDVRDFLAARLPDYMLPRTVMALDRLPRTAGGKVDRRALPEPKRNEEVETYVAPRTPVEQMLARLWAEVLKVDRVGIHSSFFALGGDSILSIRVVSRARNEGLNLTPMQMFQRPTIATLAAALAEAGCHAPAAAVTPGDLGAVCDVPRPEGVARLYPLSTTQRFVVDAYSRGRLGRGVFHGQSVWTLRDSTLSLDALWAAVEATRRSVPALRTVFVERNGQWWQGVRSGGELPLTIDDAPTRDAREVDRRVRDWLHEDRARPFRAGDRSEALWRVRAFARSDREITIGIAAHHAIIDGWSMAPLIERVAARYLMAKAGLPPDSTPELDVYEAFVAAERRDLAARRVEADAFWTEHSRHDLAWVLTPLHDPEPESPDLEYVLDADVCNGLARVQREAETTLKAVVLWAYLAALAEWAGRDAVTVGVIVNGRSPDVAGSLDAVGLYWRMAPLPFGDPAGGDPIARTRDVHRRLLGLESFAAFAPGVAIAPTRPGGPFAASFNFVRFHNAISLAGTDDISLSADEIIDRDSCGVSLRVSVSPTNPHAISLRLGHDPHYIRADAARQLMDVLRRTLSDMAGISAPA